MYSVSKSISFCYAHRLINYQGKCAHLHGHNALVEIEISGEALDERGLLIDFNDIKKAAKIWIDQNLDHKTLLHCNDPLAKNLSDFGEPLFLLNENPSAEALAKLIYEVLGHQGLKVSKVTFWETPNSCASYSL